MTQFIDITGKKFGRLTALQRIKHENYNKNLWLCDCECGNQVIVQAGNLRSGHTKSCGCLNIELASKRMKKYNKYDLSNNYGVGYTSKGEQFFFDLEDYDKIKDCCWYINQNGYVCTHSNNNKLLYMHRLIASAQDNVFVDHIHSERKNDNRKSNLRIATCNQNAMNQKLHSNNASGITGVYYSKDRNMWVANIGIKRKSYQKRFKNFEDAVAQRKAWEKEFFGEYSYDNSQKVKI
jgi:hypothetical protein